MPNLLKTLIAVLFFAACRCGAAEQEQSKRFIVLCYHDIPQTVDKDNFAVDRENFVQQLEYLRSHGWKFVSLDDVRRARRGGKPLPPKAALLTFDDGYRSFHDFVLPLLKLYNCPSVLAVITGWVENQPSSLRQPLMDWQQLKEVADSGLVEIASHTQDCHATVRYNPQGNDGWAVVSRKYDPGTDTYETESEYRKRISDDLRRSRQTLRQRLGVEARCMVWPFGEYNQISVQEAKACGFTDLFVLQDRPARVGTPDAMTRFIVVNNPPLADFVRLIGQQEDYEPQRILQADLDLIFDPDPARREKNLDAFIDRVAALQVNNVYLQAFCDANGDGNISSVYFPNRVLPMRADLFNRVVNQLAVRGVQVYAWMPMLSISLPDAGDNERLRVREFSEGKIRLSTSWYHRLSPFSGEVVEKLSMLYADMAANARISGVVFQDDGYLNDYEDFSDAALVEYRKIGGGDNVPCQRLRREQQKAWTERKTRRLIEVSEALKAAVLRYRPQAKFARTLYAPAMTEPASEEWLAQNYAESLKHYDYTVIMAYPRMEEVKDPDPWLERLVATANRYPDGLRKTVFKVQTYDWKEKRWLETRTVNRWVRRLVAGGAQHVAYYPDDFTVDKPETRLIRQVISAEEYPFARSRK